MEQYEVGNDAGAVPAARRFARRALRKRVAPAVVDAAELVATELITNALLHGARPVVLAVGPGGAGSPTRVEVRDGSRALPVRPAEGSQGMTGRGLALVDAMAVSWGVDPTEQGKAVWAELTEDSVAVSEPSDADLEELLDSFEDWSELSGPQRYTVVLGDVPTDLLLAAKAHVDSIIRELTLTAFGADSGLTASLPPHLTRLVHDVVTEFAEARQSIKRQAIAAAERGQPRTTLILTLPAEAADAGERYLAALEEADSYGRASRLLTLAAPPQQRAFRRWYVTSLVDGLRRAVAGERSVVAPTFEHHLLSEIDHLAELQAVSDRSARLQRITAVLSGVLDRSAVAVATVGEAAAELAATRGALLLPVGGQLRAEAQVGYSSSAMERYESAHRVGARTPATVALATGSDIWLESRSERDERFPDLAELEPDGTASCAVPLRVAGHLVGVLVLSFTASRMFSADERSFLGALASVAAQALERADLYDASTGMADRLLRLQTLTAALSTAPSVDAVLDVMAGHARGLVGASAVSVWLLGSDGRTVELARADPPLHGRWARFDISDPLGIAEAIRTGSQLWAASRAERDARWPAASALGDDAAGALAILPLSAHGAALGAVRLVFPEHASDEPPRELMRAFSDACTQAILRARATDRAAEANRRLAFLATASARLTTSLDVDRILQTLAGLAVPELADWCVVHLLESGELRAVAVEHADPGKAALAREVQERWPQRLSDPVGIGHVVRTGRPSLLAAVPPAPGNAPQTALGHSVEFLETVSELGLTSVLIVPLAAGNRTLGALTLVTGDSGRRYDDADLSFAEDVARRAAVAVDNARLFAAASERAVDTVFPAPAPVALPHAEPGDGLDTALSAADVGRFELHLDSERIVTDDRLAQLFGFASAEAADHLDVFLTRIHPDDVGRVRAALADAVDRRGDYAIEHRVIHPDGDVRWLGVRGRVLLDADGKAGRLAGVAYDATEARSTRDRMARLLETMTDAFFRLDRSWRFSYVNGQAERVLFRRREELLGRNVWAEFPQVAGTEFQRYYEHAMATGQPVTFEGFWAPLAVWFEVNATPESDGLSVFFRDVTARRTAEQAREAAHTRLALRAEATRGLVGTLDTGEVLSRVARVLVPELADWAVAAVLDEAGRLLEARVVHRDETLGRELDAMLRATPGALSEVPRLARVATSGVAELVPVLDERAGRHPAVAQWLRRAGAASTVVVPLQSGRNTLGVLAMVNGPDRPQFTASDLATASDIASQAGLALQNAQLYSRQRTAAEVLQRSLLTPLPTSPGLELAARYRPAAQEAQVGGDWYDAFRQPDGATVLVIGDVIGHDMGAAAAMGQLRNLLRGTAYGRAGTPAQILDRVDAAISGLPVDTLATALVARIDPGDDPPAAGGRTVHWSDAGHVPAMLVAVDGRVTVLVHEDDPLLGIAAQTGRHDHSAVLRPGETLLLYTDGLVERRDMPLDNGLDRLEALLGTLGQLPLEQLCDALLADLVPARPDDDVALLAVRPREV